MRKYVKYNGKTESFRGCSSPHVLSRGRVYVVRSQNMMSDQTNYCLDGVNGEFNSVWFDEMPVFFAFSPYVPELGTAMKLVRLEKNGDDLQPIAVFTSDAMNIEEIANDTYRILTKNSVYIVQLFQQR